MTLRLRVVALAILVAIAPLALVGVWAGLEHDIAKDMRTRLEFEALETAQQLDDGTAPSDVTDHIARVHGVRVRITDDHGAVLGDSDFDRGTDPVHQLGQLFFGPDGAPTLAGFDDSLGPLADRPEILGARTDAPTSGCRTSPGGKLLVCHGALRTSDGRVVYVQESSRRAVRSLYDLRYQLLRLSVVTLPLAAVIALVLGRSIVRPIRDLGAQARRRSKNLGDRGRLEVTGDAEVRDLGFAFNELLQRLDDRQAQNVHFTADLVHEIKNPLATVRAAADALESGKLDPARAARLARALRDAGGRLDGIVSQFLELARAEGGLAADARSPVDLAAVARAIGDACHARDDVELVVDASDPVIALGVPHGVDAVLRNLIENACSFAASRVRVTVRATDAFAEVTVEDDGAGIEPSELPKVFDRFFTTRGRDRGTGLGLALAKATVEAHGGSIRVTSEVGRGATFTARFPLPDASRGDSHEVHTNALAVSTA